jgi:hypothetical protein
VEQFAARRGVRLLEPAERLFDLRSRPRFYLWKSRRVGPAGRTLFGGLPLRGTRESFTACFPAGLFTAFLPVCLACGFAFFGAGFLAITPL